MKNKLILLTLLAICLHLTAKAQDEPALKSQDDVPPARPKIGLALSGGGAKGLAHIGILQAIDSAGLQIDYLTGTSMGSVVGSLYALGYSGNELQAISESMNWDRMLSNVTNLDAINMEEKDEYTRYAFELPFDSGKIQIPSGILRGQELWLKLSELYYPAHHIKDFNQFSIPFRCIATDVETSNAVVLDKGEIISAVRASMAIPTVFTPVIRDNKLLVDGGVVRNFPVSDVRDMGANYVIGSSVSQGLMKKEQMQSAFDILLQIMFFKEAAGYDKEKDLCDLYIPISLGEYSMGSFDNAREIVQLGRKKGDSLYETFKYVKDEMDKMYGPQEPRAQRLPEVDSVYIIDYEVVGLDRTSQKYFNQQAGFIARECYSREQLSEMVRKAWGTGAYKHLVYSLQPTDSPTQYKVIFNVEENPQALVKLGMHYNELSGISIISNLTLRDFVTRNSRTFGTINLGETIRVRAEHLQYIGRRNEIAIVPNIQYDNLNFDSYTDYAVNGLFRQRYFKGDVHLLTAGNRSNTIGVGTRFEWLGFYPKIKAPLDLNGTTYFMSSYLMWKINTLDRMQLPSCGTKVDAECGTVYNQDSDVTLRQEGIPVANAAESFGYKDNDYQYLLVNHQMYKPISKVWNFSWQNQLGLQYNYHQLGVNAFRVGGLTQQFRNQITFAGFKENTITTSSVFATQVGLRYHLSKNLYAQARSNVALYDFVQGTELSKKVNVVSGHALTIGLNTILGPLELSGQYCDQSGNLQLYVNLGIGF